MKESREGGTDVYKRQAYQIRQVRDQAVKEIAEMQGALAQAQKLSLIHI